MADPATDPFQTADSSTAGYFTTPPAAPEPKKPDNVVDLFPTKDKVEGATTALTDIQQKKIGADDVMTRQYEQREEQNRSRMERLFNAQGATVEDLKPWNAKEEMGKRETSLWEQFGSPGFVIAMLGSAFSAMPMNSALTAGGAAIEALNKGKMDDYKRAFEAWKENTELTIKRQKMEHELYDEIDHLRQTDMAAWRTKAAAIATRFDDKRKLALIQNGMESEVLQVIDAKAKAAGDLEHVSKEITDRKLKMDALNLDADWVSGDPTRMKRAMDRVEAGQQTPEQELWAQFRRDDPSAKFDKQLEVYKDIQAGKYGGARGATTSKIDATELERRRAEYLKTGMSPAEAYDKAKKEVKQAGATLLDDEAIDSMAKQYLAGDKSVFQNLGRGAQGAENVVRVREAVSRVAKEQGLSGSDVALRIAEFNALTAGERTLGSRTANVEMFVNEARNQMAVARRLSEEVPRGEFVPINRALLSFENNTGDPKVVAFGASINTLVNTYAKAIAGGGQATVSDKDHAREILLSAYTPEQFEAVLDVLNQEMEAAREAPRQVKQQFRDLTHGDKLEGIPTPDRNVIKYDAEGNRVQ